MGGANASPEMTQWLWSIWPSIDIEKALNSNFTTSLIGALLGALAGAWGAQRIAERSKLREELIREIRNTNTAISVCFGIANAALGLKKQYVKPMKETYDAHKLDLLEHKRKREAGEVARNVLFEFNADLMTLQLPSQPTEMLQEIVFERLSITGKPLNLVMIVNQVVGSLISCFARRNALIEGYKKGFGDIPDGMVVHYFGLPYGEGHVNAEYPGVMEAISLQTDDCIHFNRLLAQELFTHGSELAVHYEKKFSESAPKISELTFREAQADGLMPDPKNYTDWDKAFMKREDFLKKSGPPQVAHQGSQD